MHQLLNLKNETFFFETAENKDVVTGQNNLRLANNLNLTESGRDHLVRRGWLIPSSRDSPAFQERHGNRLCWGTGQDAAPSAVPSSSDAPWRTLASERDFSQARLQGKLSSSPPAARDRSCPGALDKSSLCVSSLLAGRCRLFGPRSVGGSRSHESRHPSGVQGQLAAAEQR